MLYQRRNIVKLVNALFEGKVDFYPITELSHLETLESKNYTEKISVYFDLFSWTFHQKRFFPSLGKILWHVFEKSSGQTNERTETGFYLRTKVESRWVKKIFEAIMPNNTNIFDIRGERRLFKQKFSSLGVRRFSSVSNKKLFENIISKQFW